MQKNNKFNIAVAICGTIAALVFFAASVHAQPPPPPPPPPAATATPGPAGAPINNATCTVDVSSISWVTVPISSGNPAAIVGQTNVRLSLTGMATGNCSGVDIQFRIAEIDSAGSLTENAVRDYGSTGMSAAMTSIGSNGLVVVNTPPFQFTTSDWTKGFETFEGSSEELRAYARVIYGTTETNSSQDLTLTQPGGGGQTGTCTVSRIYFQRVSGNNYIMIGEKFNIVAEGTPACAGQQISFNIWEHDFSLSPSQIAQDVNNRGGDDFLGTVGTATFDAQGRAQFCWTSSKGFLDKDTDELLEDYDLYVDGRWGTNFKVGGDVDKGDDFLYIPTYSENGCVTCFTPPGMAIGASCICADGATVGTSNWNEFLLCRMTSCLSHTGDALTRTCSSTTGGGGGGGGATPTPPPSNFGKGPPVTRVCTTQMDTSQVPHCAGNQCDACHNITQTGPIPAGWLPLVPCGRSDQCKTTCEECKFCDFFKLAQNLILFTVFEVVPPISIFFIALGGLLILLSAGNESRRTRGKEVLRTTIVGIIIIFTAWIIVNTVIKTFATNLGGGQGNSWWSFQCGTATSGAPAGAPAANATCSITATPAGVTSGDPVTLAWSTSNAADGFISGVGSIASQLPSGSIMQFPFTSSVYTLTVTNAEGMPATCSASVSVNQPTPPPCIPNCSGKECAGDGCGGSCGSCGQGTTCDFGSGRCVTVCVPETDAAFCSRLNKTCGTANGQDNCGSARAVASCGGCTAPDTCNAAGTCACIPSCAGKVCGPNGCNGTCAPGCTGGAVCNASGQCACNATQTSCGGTCQDNPSCTGVCQSGTFTCTGGTLVCNASADGTACGTDQTCIGGACTNRYACGGGACSLAVNGMYTASDCGGNCDPPSCSITADRGAIGQGESTTLTWNTNGNPTNASISNGIGTVNPAGGSVTVTPSLGTVYTMTVTNANGSNSCNVEIIVTDLFVKDVCDRYQYVGGRPGPVYNQCLTANTNLINFLYYFSTKYADPARVAAGTCNQGTSMQGCGLTPNESCFSNPGGCGPCPTIVNISDANIAGGSCQPNLCSKGTCQPGACASASACQYNCNSAHYGGYQCTGSVAVDFQVPSRTICNTMAYWANEVCSQGVNWISYEVESSLSNTLHVSRSTNSSCAAYPDFNVMPKPCP